MFWKDLSGEQLQSEILQPPQKKKRKKTMVFFFIVVSFDEKKPKAKRIGMSYYINTHWLHNLIWKNNESCKRTAGTIKKSYSSCFWKKTNRRWFVIFFSSWNNNCAFENTHKGNGPVSKKRCWWNHYLELEERLQVSSFCASKPLCPTLLPFVFAVSKKAIGWWWRWRWQQFCTKNTFCLWFNVKK